MNKIFAFIAIATLLLTSFIPVAENVVAEESNESKTIEVPVQIYTLHGVKEIRKELPIDEAMKLQKMAYEAKEAMEILFNKNASFMEKIRANAIIDSLLYEMKKNGLLGNLTIKEAKELITGKYFMRNRNSVEIQRFNAIAKFFQQNGWQVNALCGMFGAGGFGIHPWNYILLLLFLSELIIISEIAFLLLVILDAIPHPTTIGFWSFVPYGFYPQHPWIETWGLLGYKKLEGYELVAITLGFIGSVIVVPLASIAIGFCPFIAMKRVE